MDLTKTLAWRSILAPVPVALLLLLLMVTRLILFYLGSEERLIGIIPDDAFYYIQLAKHRVADGFWTFDGTSKATGFHLLYAYLLVVIFFFDPDIEWQTLYILIGSISAISLSISALYLMKLIGKVFDKKVQLFGFLPFVSVPIFMQSTSLMESWAVILLSTLGAYTVIQKSSSENRLWYLTIFLIGLLGSLARTDFGLLPGVLFCASYFLTGFKIQGITRGAFFLLAGAILGLSIALLHNYIATGNFLQASAQVKLHWSSMNGHSFAAPVELLVRSIISIFPGVGPTLFFIVCAVGLFILSITRAAKSIHGGLKSERFIVFIACAVTLVGYMFVYRHNSGALQDWYAANFVVPLVLVMSGVIYYAMNKIRFSVALISFFGYLTSCVLVVTHIPYPHQSAMMKAGMYLRGMSTNHVYAAWNAGIISFFSGKPLVNLDGLTNDDAIPYILDNTLIDYIKGREIGFIVDYDQMFSEQFRLRGGYDDSRIDNCIRLVQPIGDNSEQWGSSLLSLYSVDQVCPK